MNHEPISLEHAALLKERLREAGTLISEFSFANLYLFRRKYHFAVLRDADDVFVTGQTITGQRFLMLTRDPRRMNAKRLKEIAADYDFLYPIPEEWLSAFQGASFEDNPNDSDYMFTPEKLTTYPGKSLHGQRNFLRQFETKYRHEVVPITPANVKEAVAVLDGWQVSAGQPVDKTDVVACREALDLLEPLCLCGGLYRADGKPAGFLLCEDLGAEVYALHFAKGLREFKGIYPFMYSFISRILPTHFKWINFAQDLGDPGLRAAKRSYVPDRLVSKYRVRPA